MTDWAKRRAVFESEWASATFATRRALRDFARYPTVGQNQGYVVGFLAGAGASDYWIAVAGSMPVEILTWIVEEFERGAP